MINSHYLLFLLISTIFAIENNNNTEFKMHKSQFESRQNRLLTFNTQANGDISMEIAFNVPFITIPVKKTVDMAQGAVANLNIGAVILAGAIAFGFAVVIPGITLLLSKPASLAGYRSDERDARASFWHYVDHALMEHNIDATACFQKMVCWHVKKSAQNVNKGTSSSMDRIIDGIAASRWLHRFIDGSAMQEAIENGVNLNNCANEYSQCKISQNTIQMFTKQMFGYLTY